MCSRVNNFEPRDGLVCLLPAFARLDFDEILRGLGGKEAPTFVTAYQRVPGRGSYLHEKVNNMDLTFFKRNTYLDLYYCEILNLL